ncbi:MFS transporter [Alkalihalophilus sp. As8PL]|uniref:MFS transporter n=1 Tax=Alkalihalophilus sp. As8PL TaxID=3237103 RepID=A0AB39BPN4_9BACI
MKETFSQRKVLVIGSGFFALTLIWTFYNAYMPLILANHIERTSIIGAIMGLDNLLAVLLIPLIGAWSDQMNTRFGKRLPFLMVGMPLAALFFVLLPFMQSTLWTLLFIDILFLLAMTLYRAPVISLMPDHTAPERRSLANGYINLMGGIGAIVALFGLSQLYQVNSTYPFIVASILLMSAFLLLFRSVDRHPPYTTNTNNEQEEVQARRSVTRGLAELFLKKHRGQAFILFAIFVYFIGYASIEALFTLYATRTLGFTEGLAGLTLGFFSLSFVLFAVPAGWIGQKLGKVETMVIGLILLPLFFVAIPFISTPLLLQVFLFLAGVAWALINVQAYPLVADLGGLAKIGLFTGLYYLFSMSAQLIGPTLLGLMMDFFGGAALFFSASATFVVAYFLLQHGKKKIEQTKPIAA